MNKTSVKAILFSAVMMVALAAGSVFAAPTKPAGKSASAASSAASTSAKSKKKRHHRKHKKASTPAPTKKS